MLQADISLEAVSPPSPTNAVPRTDGAHPRYCEGRKLRWIQLAQGGQSAALDNRDGHQIDRIRDMSIDSAAI